MDYTLHETRNYDEFKFIKENRKTVARHVERLVESIKKKNLTKDFPIIVNDEMEILDGQNRFEALKILGYPVPYRKAMDMNKKDISLINTMHKGWSTEDYLHQYCVFGYPDYLKLKDFIDWCGNVTLSQAMKIIKNKKRYVADGGFGDSGEGIEMFKLGQFKYPIDDSKAKGYVLRLRELSAYTEKRNPFDRSLIVALDCIESTDGFDFERLSQKLKNYPIGVYNDANSLIAQLETAYNYNVPHKGKLIFRRAK